MPKKKRAARPAGAVSAKQRASDDALRAALRDADLGKFDRALKKAIRPPGRSRSGD